MKTKLVIGNWKMNGQFRVNTALLADLVPTLGTMSTVRVGICPPFPYIGQVASSCQGTTIEAGAQNLSQHEAGAYTGEVSGEMLHDLGCRYVLVGHSERRSFYHESDELVALKFDAARASNLTPVLCVGETLEQRKAGVTFDTVRAQLKAVIDRVGIGAIADGVIAYEPVWAIGTGETASPEQAQAVHRDIRSYLADHNASVAERVDILYGGSVKADNAGVLFSQPDIDGGLIGGASLDATSFVAICAAAKQA
ncbi:triose-phosphate isomerase [Pseudomonas syringae]|uniref:triose-phosphate isomerase n=1 Tax=Pseudomonas syringae TaxID=317 RepID=UPI0006E6A914|nr:triose-phosphate isomerase [Pseudomonas syringae]KPY45370.1 Triosephosphate isomerase [Pseudomonas syringae pv. rhaphiolepidis]KWS45722.1 triose-phosphate isomerase [Pseudomonas syringae pv. rhaphiolepidis]